MDAPIRLRVLAGRGARPGSRGARVCGPEWRGAGATEGDPVELGDSPVAAAPSAQRRTTADITHLKTPGAFVAGEE
eukprot:7251352-Prymnesium_polylepis.1